MSEKYSHKGASEKSSHKGASEKYSHEGASGMGAGHVKRMMNEHGCPDHRRVYGAPTGHGGNQNEAKGNKGFEKHAERDEREGG